MKGGGKKTNIKRSLQIPARESRVSRRMYKGYGGKGDWLSVSNVWVKQGDVNERETGISVHVGYVDEVEHSSSR